MQDASNSRLHNDRRHKLSMFRDVDIHLHGMHSCSHANRWQNRSTLDGPCQRASSSVHAMQRINTAKLTHQLCGTIAPQAAMSVPGIKLDTSSHAAEAQLDIMQSGKQISAPVTNTTQLIQLGGGLSPLPMQVRQGEVWWAPMAHKSRLVLGNVLPYLKALAGAHSCNVCSEGFRHQHLLPPVHKFDHRQHCSWPPAVPHSVEPWVKPP